MIGSELGDISFATTKEKEDYTYSIPTCLGELYFENKMYEGVLGASVTQDTDSDNKLTIESNGGNITVRFGA